MKLFELLEIIFGITLLSALLIGGMLLGDILS